MFRFFAIISSLFIFSTAASSYVCNGTTQVYPPANITNNPITFPANWNISTNPVDYAPGQTCIWKINVPKGLFAFVSIKANTSSVSSLTITGSNGYVERITSTNGDPYFHVDSFNVTLFSSPNAQSGTFGMSISWYTIPSVNATVNQTISANSDPLVLYTTAFDHAFISADSQISLVSVPSSSIFATDLLANMRSIVFFDGPSTNSTYLGNMYENVASGVQLVTSGKQLTILMILPGVSLGSILVQEYSNVKDIKNYRGVYCPVANFCGQTMNSTNGKSAIFSISSSPVFLKTEEIPPGSSLSVYGGRIQQSALLTTYKRGDGLNLPQKFTSYVTTFVLDQGSAYFDLSYAKIYAKWNMPVEGRRGFIASPEFSRNSINQDFTESIVGTKNYNFTLNIRGTGLTGNSTLAITTFDGTNTVFDKTYSQQSADFQVNCIGKSLFVTYNQNGENSTGAYLQFEIFEAKSSSKIASSAVLISFFSVLYGVFA